jgi:acyl-CoA-binding protein
MSEEFVKTAQLVKALGIDPQTQLVLYGLYKQATQGDNLAEEPAEPVAKAKHLAWMKNQGKTSEQAEQEYIQIVSSFTGEGWKMGVSRPVLEDEEPEELNDAEKLVKSLCESIKSGTPDEALLDALGVNVKDKNGLTPLHHAVDEGLAEMVGFLLSRGADVNSQDDLGMTPGHYAGELENPEILSLLLSSSLDLSIEDLDGNSVRSVLRGACAEIIKT